MTFRERGFWKFYKRLGVYLTNSLEQSEVQPDMLSFGFAESIAEEAKEADKVKNETPIMVVIGNPPYSVSSSNKGKWIQDLIKDYKKGLGERKINLDDDYIKFIRFAEHFVEKNKTGIVAMITNNSYIDGITHRQMRKHLLETFDEIYILDLHGNSKKKEKAPDGGKDENVFDIQQGVSISIFVRKNEATEKLGSVYHAELFGKRDKKFEELNNYDLEKIKWQKLDYSEPYYFFVPKDFELEDEYKKGFKINELFEEYNSGIQTKNDAFTVSFNKKDLENRLSKFSQLSLEEAKQLFGKNGIWKIEKAYEDIREGNVSVERYQYKYLDTRYIAYSSTNKILGRSRSKTSRHILTGENYSLVLMRGTVDTVNFNTVSVTTNLVDINFYGFQTYFFPIYLYQDKNSRKSNFNCEIVAKILKIVDSAQTEDIFNYVYAVLHSLRYREKYIEFLKIDFPRIPYPQDAKSFEKLSNLGNELRLMHLLESPKVNQFITTFSVSGSDTIEKISYKDGKVFFNSEQYFGKVPEVAWNFYIGGYQPAQKWLKDRKGRVLTNEDIEHYQKMIVGLTETDRIMKEIDKVNNNND